MDHLTHIEPLESRIAPALILNPYTVTFQDGSGDTAIIKISKPLFTSAAAAAKILLFTDTSGNSITESFTGNGTAENLNEIDLLGRTDAQGMNISVKVIPQVGVGSGQVDVGGIAAANFSVTDQVTQNIDLGSIYIQGNLGFITAGDQISTPAIASLNVLSMNQFETSDVLGSITKMTVHGDFNASLLLIGYQFGSIGTLTIGGSLAGDTAGDSGSGQIQFMGHIGSATIGNITGTSADNTGELLGFSSFTSYIGSLHVTGNITGGAGQDSGRVFAESSIGKVTVDGNLQGGAGQDSGEIAGPLGTVKIAGSVTGSTGISSGSILSETFSTSSTAVSVALGSVTIGGDLQGGTAGVAAVGSTAATVGDSGIIMAAGANSITIAGSLIGGASGDTNGDILVNSVKTLTIGNNITGGSASNSGIITADGTASLSPIHYGSIVVYGDVAGGSGATSGSIIANGLIGGTIGSLHIGEGLTGSSGTQSGEVYAGTSLGTLYVGGNVTGGTADNTGEIYTGGALTSGIIKGNLAGNTTIDSATSVVDSGYLQAGHIASLDIQGNVTSGANSGGLLANSGAIRSSGDILSLTIGGAVTGTSANAVVISAASGPAGSAAPKTDLAIASVHIGGAASYLDLLAGYSTTVSGTVNSSTDPAGAPLGAPVDGSAQIGAVTFGSTLSASNIVAGAKPDSSGFFGTSGNSAITARTGTLRSSIASIIVAGQATGDSTPADSFGIVAESLGAVKVDGVAIPTNTLVAGTPVAVNSTNLHLLEVT